MASAWYIHKYVHTITRMHTHTTYTNTGMDAYKTYMHTLQLTCVYPIHTDNPIDMQTYQHAYYCMEHTYMHAYVHTQWYVYQTQYVRLYASIGMYTHIHLHQQTHIKHAR